MARVIRPDPNWRAPQLRLVRNFKVGLPLVIAKQIEADLDRTALEEDKPVSVIIREAMEGWFGPDWQPPANNLITVNREICSAIKARCEPRWGKVLSHYREERREEERRRLEDGLTDS